MDEKFNELVEEFLSKMAAVDATVEDYVTALRTAQGEIEVAIEASEASDRD